jgi:hypothetical protein
MEDKGGLLESLFERAEDYSKTSLELLKLKALDKSSGVAAACMARGMVCIVLILFILMMSLGVALWLGDLLGKTWYGFIIVAAFYGIKAFVLYFFMGKWLRKVFGNFIIKQALK